MPYHIFKSDFLQWMFFVNLLCCIIDDIGNLVVEYAYDVWGIHAVLSANGADLTERTHIDNRKP